MLQYSAISYLMDWTAQLVMCISSGYFISALQLFCVLFWNCSMVFPNEASPMALHTNMFVPTLESLATPEQKEKWLSRAANFEIIGTYAQTELGHGTSADELLTLNFDYCSIEDIQCVNAILICRSMFQQMYTVSQKNVPNLECFFTRMNQFWYFLVNSISTLLKWYASTTFLVPSLLLTLFGFK